MAESEEECFLDALMKVKPKETVPKSFGHRQRAAMRGEGYGKVGRFEGPNMLSGRWERAIDQGEHVAAEDTTVAENITSQESPLLLLPPEIRNLIYEEVARATTVYVCHSAKAAYALISKGVRWILPPGILLACTQTRQESMAIMRTFAIKRTCRICRRST